MAEKLTQRDRERLIERHMPLVRSLARRYAGRGEPLDDLIQVGASGLIKAVDRFEPDRGIQLSTYATPTILGEIKRHFRDKSWSVRVPRGLQELHAQLQDANTRFQRQYGRSPTVAELAASAKVTEEEAVEALVAGQAYQAESLSKSSGGGDDDDRDLLDTLGTGEGGYGLVNDRAALAAGFAHLPPRERTILHLRFFEGLTQSEIADRVGISQMHVSRLLRRSLEDLHDLLAPAPEDGGPVRERRPRF